MSQNLKPYTPSNGSEGMSFIDKWCENCTRHSLNPGAKTQCVHLFRSFVDDDNKRWYYVDGVPTCLSFRDKQNRKRHNKKVRPDKNQLIIEGM